METPNPKAIIKNRPGKESYGADMPNGKGIKVKLWREGKNVIVRSDALHITTYGKSTKQALENFKEALSLALEGLSEKSIASKRTLPFEFELSSSYGRKTSAHKAAPSY